MIQRTVWTPRRHRFFIATLALVSLVLSLGGFQAFSAVATSGDTPPEPSAADTAAATTGSESARAGDLLDCTGNQEPANFTIYSLGPSAGGYEQSTEQRTCSPYQVGEIARADFVSYAYGSCTIAPDADSCAPPLEIQSWPACERSLAIYEKRPGTPYPRTYLGEIRGAPIYSFDGGTRIEVYSADTTIAIFASDPDLANAATAQIQRESASTPPPQDPANQPADNSLAPPDDGSTTGTLTCS
jgi:hypothetical protein